MTKRIQAKPKDGYRSKLEASVAESLKRMKKKRWFKKVSYEEDIFSYFIDYDYHPDFKITRRDGSIFYIEVKGYLDTITRRKMRSVKECHPEMELYFLFPKEAKLPGLQKTNVQWAKLHGFECHCGLDIPKEWF